MKLVDRERDQTILTTTLHKIINKRSPQCWKRKVSFNNFAGKVKTNTSILNLKIV